MAEEEARFRADVQDRTRAERAAIELAARLRTGLGGPVAVTVGDGESVAGTLVDVAAQWLLIESPGAQDLVPMHAICLVSGLPQRASELGAVERRLGIGHALRALARDRVRVVVHTQGGNVTGLLGAVGADYVEVSTGLGQQVAVPLLAIRRIRSAA